MSDSQLQAHIKRFGGTNILQMLRFSNPDELNQR